MTTALGGDLSALILLGADPLRTHPDRSGWARALAATGFVVAFADFPTPELTEHADVIFPLESYAEREGTVTHPDGRIQRLRQAIGHPGDVRPVWSVLAELSARLGIPGEPPFLTSPMVSRALFDAIPFYAGLTLEEIGGKGRRWQERSAAAAAPAAPAAPRAGGARDTARAARDPERRPAPRHRPLAVGRSRDRTRADPALPCPGPARRALRRGRRATRRGQRRRGHRRPQRVERPRRGGAARRPAAAERLPLRGDGRAQRHRAHRTPRRAPSRCTRWRRSDRRRARLGRRGGARCRSSRWPRSATPARSGSSCSRRWSSSSSSSRSSPWSSGRSAACSAASRPGWARTASALPASSSRWPTCSSSSRRRPPRRPPRCRG